MISERNFELEQEYIEDAFNEGVINVREFNQAMRDLEEAYETQQ